MKTTTTLIHGDDSLHWDAAVTPSIAQGSNWELPSAAVLAEVATEPLYPYMYNRKGNPNHEQAAAIIARLEGGERALMTASGMSAVSTLALALLKAGDHVVVQKSIYAGVSNLCYNVLPRLGVECTFVDQTSTAAFEAAMRDTTRLVLLETPSNPLLEITDIRAVAEIAHAAGAYVATDNTFATPLNQQPLDLGSDFSWHSCTKYLGGHSDLLAGAVVGTGELIDRVWHTHEVLGGVLAPFNAWLLLRGLRTLSVRMARHNSNGLALAKALEEHSAVTAVNYPGLEKHPGHEIAARQMSAFGGMLSFTLEGGYEAASAFVTSLQYARHASSLGHVGSLVIHPAAMWGAAMTTEELRAAGVDPGLIRFSVGIEDEEDVIEDVYAALDKSGSR
ncbi:aminotransferase class I/II-fold pyridoxal phosphate-dependent enzyme [Amycolatopsis sp. NPDC051102]|uniref:trans-sulfuration enzyme family protein n=1 Tax=Amycolatopsis sp. NPDC051102 TaxID=3155163 RepID=UPI00341A8ABF